MAQRPTEAPALILPFGTDALLSRGISAAMAGGMVLLTSGPGWSALNVVGFGFVLLGAAPSALPSRVPGGVSRPDDDLRRQPPV